MFTLIIFATLGTGPYLEMGYGAFSCNNFVMYP
jgi:hypothetical protein